MTFSVTPQTKLSESITVIVYFVILREVCVCAADGPVVWVVHVARSFLEEAAVQNTTSTSRHPTGPYYSTFSDHHQHSVC